MTGTLTPDAFAWVSDVVRRESAIVLDRGKEYLVEARLMPVARELGIADVSGLVATLRASPDRERVRRLVEALTTNETSWFRDSEPFAALRTTVLPELLAARRPTEPLKIWSAACSSGQEPYTIAMTLRDVVPEHVGRISILGTDISEAMLTRARNARFSQLEVNRGLPAPQLVRWFHRQGIDWEIAPELRSMVRFEHCNLAAPLSPMLGTFDVIYLRNVLIYFDADTKRDILARVRRVLRPDGYLFLGATETTLGIDETWERVPSGRGSYYRPSRGA